MSSSQQVPPSDNSAATARPAQVRERAPPDEAEDEEMAQGARKGRKKALRDGGDIPAVVSSLLSSLLLNIHARFDSAMRRANALWNRL